MTFKIGDLHPNTPHLFADLAELMLLVGYIGRNTLHKNDLENLIESGTISSEELDEEINAEREAEDTNLATAERRDRKERQLEDVLTQLKYRSKAFKEFYPFIVSNEHIELIDPLSAPQRIYRLLLACSRLRSFQRAGIPQKWARFFVKVSKEAMQGLLPSEAETRIFDANSRDRKEYYSTDLRLALKKLGDDLGVQVDQDECQKAGSSGDAGLDLIGTISFNDGAAVNYAILGQCGAQERAWSSKTLEAHPIRLSNYFKILFEYPSVMFTPVCYRNATGEWVKNTTTTGILLADRVRILSLIGKRQNCDELITTNWFKEFEDEFSSIEIY